METGCRRGELLGLVVRHARGLVGADLKKDPAALEAATAWIEQALEEATR